MLPSMRWMYCCGVSFMRMILFAGLRRRMDFTSSAICRNTTLLRLQENRPPNWTTNLQVARSEEDQAAADAHGDGFGPSGGAKVAEDGGDVKFCRVVGDGEPRRDLFVAET